MFEALLLGEEVAFLVLTSNPGLTTVTARFDPKVVLFVFFDVSFGLVVDDRSWNFLERIWVTNVELQTGNYYGNVRPLYLRRDISEDHTFLYFARLRANYLRLGYLLTIGSSPLGLYFLQQSVCLLLENVLRPKQ